MTALKEILKTHLWSHPSMLLQDAIKLIYQNEFGCGHMIADPVSSLARLKQEYAATPQRTDCPLFEPLGNGLVRLNLAALGKTKLRIETLNAMFVYTAQTVQGTRKRFEEKLNILREMISRGEWPDMQPDALEQYLSQYRQQGYPAVSHTPAYRAQEAPAYRVISAQFEQFFRFFEAVDSLPGERLLIGIDGRCASGKTTLGRLAAQVYNANLLHMDDFFLPFERKTAERLAEPGGNVDYERFEAEVLAPLRVGILFSFRPFQCHNGSYGTPVEVTPRRISIVEGTYAHHPHFASPYQLRVMLTTSPQTQSDRILTRNGEVMHRRFINEWIPLEEAYFSGCAIAEQADLIVET